MTEIKAILFPLYKAGHIIYAVTIKAYDKIKKSHTTQWVRLPLGSQIMPKGNEYANLDISSPLKNTYCLSGTDAKEHCCHTKKATSQLLVS